MKFKTLFTSVMMLALLCFNQLAQADQHGAEQHKAHNIILIGPPASGKGTQGKFISEAFNIPTISAGDLLRAEVRANSPRSEMLQEIMKQGGLVPDEIVLELIKERIEEPDAQNGFILDGFPRSKGQAMGLEKLGVDIHHVVVLEVPDEEIVKRISGRWIHPASGRTYHTETNPPKVPGKDDETGEPLVQRDDDTPEAVKKRLKTFRDQTVPVIDWYKAKASEQNSHVHVSVVDGMQPINKVKVAIFTQLNA